MKATQWILISLISSVVIFSSCKKCKDEDKCVSFASAPVTKVTGATTGNINQAIDLTVSYGVFNACGRFERFEQNTTGNSTAINIIAKYQGCICQQVALTLQTTYQFKASQPGTYNLNFLQYKDTYLTHTIVIQ